MQPNIDSAGSRDLHQFTAFLLRACHLTGGRITVVAKPAEGNEAEEKIVAAALWLPPNKRIALWHVLTLLRSRIVTVLSRWGLTALKVHLVLLLNDICADYASKAHRI